MVQVIYPDQYNADDDNLDLTAEPPVNIYANANVGDRYTYDGNGNILTYTNQYGEVTTNSYDADGNLTSTTKPDGTVFTFDEDGRAKKETYQGGLVRDFTYTSNQTVISNSNGVTETYNLNSFGEVAEYKLQNGEIDKSYSYTYDSNGNITTISLNGNLQHTFTYNSSNELVRVDDAVANKSTTYEYDYVGNITAVNTYIYTVGELSTPLTTENYTYNSQNQRTDLSYDANGNMTELNGYTFGWTNRRLTSATSTDNSISYTYNHNGIRTSKTINGSTTYYEIDENNNVVKQYELVNDVESNVIEFVYDSNGTPIYFTYNNATYYYEKNLQGDIVAILDANGNTVVEYSYDIWGKLLGITGELAETLGAINPLRYRGYYYDTETGLYYLQSRYYSPDLMRFISQDDPVFSNAQGEPLGSNLYVYCLNNPVMNLDVDGKIALLDDMTVLAFIGLCAAASIINAWMSTSEFRRSWAAFCTAVGNGLNWIGTTIANGGRAAWNWTKTQIKAATTALTIYIAISRADAQIKTKIKSNSKQRYWAASIVNYSGYTYVVISSAISYSTAKARVASGLCVFTVTKSEARRLASKFPPIVGPEFHGAKVVGQYWHYHVRNRKSKSHIFFLF